MKKVDNFNVLSQDPNNPVEIVISLRDSPYERIKSGIKTYEFRRRWRTTPCIAFVYRSGGRKELSAYMKLGTPIFGSPQEMSRIAEEMSPGNGDSVEEYLLSSQGGYAIPIEEFHEFEPLSLAQIKPLGFHPPQLFFYLANYPELRELIKERISTAGHIC